MGYLMVNDQWLVVNFFIATLFYCYAFGLLLHCSDENRDLQLNGSAMQYDC